MHKKQDFDGTETKNKYCRFAIGSMKKVDGRLDTAFFPLILIVILVVGFLWIFAYAQTEKKQWIPIKVWEQKTQAHFSAHAEVLSRIALEKPENYVETTLRTTPFWFFLKIPQTAKNSSSEVIDFPSRHASTLACWDGQTDRFLGKADRLKTEGAMVGSRAGFAIALNQIKSVKQLLCRGEFRGPAKITVALWQPEELAKAQKAYDRSAVALESGIGVLAATMLIAAVVNRSWVYMAFFVWLLCSMRMAAISAGTDFHFFGYLLHPDMLITIRKWTVGLYSSITGLIFILIFRYELKKIGAGWGIKAVKIAIVGFPLLCVFLDFEEVLAILWAGSTFFIVLFFYYLFKIVLRANSRAAYWFMASVIITLLASFSEILAAALGMDSMATGLNSVTAAVASALLVSAALAEQMRADRLGKLEAQRVLRAAYENSPIGLFSLTPEGNIFKMNPAFRKTLRNLGFMDKKNISEVFDARAMAHIASLGKSPEQAIELQTRIRDTKTGLDRWFAIKASTVNGSTVEGSLQDITERFAATERLEFLAHHDPLTECLNLRGIANSLARTKVQPSALAYFDLNRFKLINDLYGHAAGDSVIQQVCKRMKGAMGEASLLARVGGDEFVIAFCDCTVAEATVLCESVVHAITSQPFHIGAQRFTLGVSAGLVGTRRFGDAPLKEVISAADTLCRMAKKRTAQQLIVMESDDSFFHHHKQELEVMACLERGEIPAGLFLMVQPEISLHRPFDSLNFEFLLRMRKFDGSIVSAGTIIEAAELHGKTAIIDRWVVSTAIAWLHDHLGALQNTCFAGINISGGSLNDEAFIEEIVQLFARHPEVLSMVCIEITESVALTDLLNVQRFIDRVRSLGVKVAIDDFGAGYSSFGYLKKLSVDALKIDGNLVRDALQSSSGLAIIDAIGGLVANLGMKSIGEYAENLATLKFLVNAGIDYAQGYAISKPVMPERLLTARSSVDFIEDPEVLAFVSKLEPKDEISESLLEKRQKATFPSSNPY